MKKKTTKRRARPRPFTVAGAFARALDLLRRENPTHADRLLIEERKAAAEAFENERALQVARSDQQRSVRIIQEANARIGELERHAASGDDRKRLEAMTHEFQQAVKERDDARRSAESRLTALAQQQKALESTTAQLDQERANVLRITKDAAQAFEKRHECEELGAKLDLLGVPKTDCSGGKLLTLAGRLERFAANAKKQVDGAAVPTDDAGVLALEVDFLRRVREAQRGMIRKLAASENAMRSRLVEAMEGDEVLDASDLRDLLADAADKAKESA